MTGKGGDAIRSPRWLSIEDRSLQEIYESVRELLLETLNEDEGWKGLTRDDISVEPLSGGITNKMFKCEPPKPLTPVVTRVYGSSTDKFVSRTDESEMALALNKSNFGAKVRAVFQNGWVEDFIESSSLVPLDMKKTEILTTVAGIIKRFHELDMPHRIARPQAIAETATTSSPYGEGAAANVAGEFWETIEVWYSMALEVSFPEDPEKQKLLDALCVPQLKEKIKRVRKMCDGTNSPTVFCHNDIHAGNFLVEEPSKKLILIDFEYSAHGPRGFDLANFFCEFAGFECDYSLLPDKTTREVFYEIYLSAGDTVEQLEKEVEGIRPGGFLLKNDADALAGLKTMAGSLALIIERNAVKVPEFGGNAEGYKTEQVTSARDTIISSVLVLNEVLAFQKQFEMNVSGAMDRTSTEQGVDAAVNFLDNLVPKP